jgi:hypothetical protein
MDRKTYLGDGVYARFDGDHIWLTTENSIAVTNTIALERQDVTAREQVLSSMGRPTENP